MTSQLRAQYGLLSAGAFPPHATLIGSQHIDRPHHEIVAALDAELAGVPAFPAYNSGPVRQGIGLVYDVDHLADGTTVNHALRALAARVAKAVRPLVSAVPNSEPHDFDPATFRAHLSLASHDLYARTDLLDEVADYVSKLPIEYPRQFTADTVALYRTRSADWTGRWWTTLEWTHLHSWRLRRAPLP